MIYVLDTQKFTLLSIVMLTSMFEHQKLLASIFYVWNQQFMIWLPEVKQRKMIE